MTEANLHNNADQEPSIGVLCSEITGVTAVWGDAATSRFFVDFSRTNSADSCSDSVSNACKVASERVMLAAAPA